MVLVDGITYMHEHTTINLSRIKENDDTNLNCFDETVSEYKKLYEKGVRNIVDVTNLDMKRNPEYAKKAGDLSGINIVLATGFYTHKFLPEFVMSSSARELADFMVNEIQNGIAGTKIKAQIIGEIGSSKDGWTPAEKKIFDASIIAQKATSVPITTHTTLGTFGHEQIAYFQESGVDMEKILIGHADLSGDVNYVLHMLDQGVYVGFDTVGKENYLPDMERVRMLKEIEKRGFIHQLVLSMDITRKSNMEYKGGIGYSYLLDVFVPMLLENGVSEMFVDRMLTKNPQTFFDKE